MDNEVNVVINRVSESAWRKFLEEADGATVYHTPEWKKVLEETFGYRPYYMFVVDDTGDVQGLLPLMLVCSKLFGARLSSLPLAHKCGYIGDSMFREPIKDAALELYADHIKKGTLEVRDRMEEPFLESQAFSTYILEFGVSVEETWSKFHRSVRRRIKQADRAGVQVETSRDMTDVKEFYDINCQIKRVKGVPCHPLKFFKNIFKQMPEYSKLYLAKVDGEVVGGGLMLYFGNTVIYGYGAAKSCYLKRHPYHAFICKAIEDAVRDGFRYFDFGRVHRDNIGLAEFKRQWGADEVPLPYSYYPVMPRLNEVRNKSILKKMVTRMPMWLYKLSSNWIFGQVV